MSAAEDKKSQVETGSGTGGYIWLLLLFILVGSANLIIGQVENSRNSRWPCSSSKKLAEENRFLENCR